MGAMPWKHLAPWRPKPTEALRELQAAFLTDNYDLAAELQKHLDSAREAVRLTEAEGDPDPYDLLEIYREERARLEKLARRPLPTDPRRQIDLLRKIHAASGEGIGNVLDVKGVSGRKGLHLARRLSKKELRERFGTPTPSKRQAEAGLHELYEGLDRGESVCFPVYAEDDPPTPAGWYFVGYTVD